MTLHFSHIGLTDARTFTALRNLLLIKEKGRRDPGDGQAPKYSRRTLAGAVSARSGCRGGIRLELMPRRKDARALGRDRHGELEMARQRAVLGVDGPVVAGHANRVAA